MILMIGINHRSARLDLRERVALGGERLDGAFEQLRGQYPLMELVILSTCNRTELYVHRPAHEAPSSEQLADFLCRFCGVGTEELTAALINRENEQAVSHLFRVAGGLDSMVPGEPQVLGQVKRAYEDAHRRRAVGPILHKVFQSALAAGKRVRAETGIDEGRVSIGSAAVDFARQIFERFDDKVVVAVGAGEMAKVAIRHLRGLEPAKLWVTNRSPERARALADQFGLAPHTGGVRAFEDLDHLLIEADIVLTSTGASEPIITARRFKPLVRRRRNRPLFLIDIALPRDVEPAVGSLRNVYLYDLDDLQQVVTATFSERNDHMRQCQDMLVEAARTCLHEIQHRDVGQLIRSLRHKLHGLARAEQERTARKIAAAPPEEVPQLLDEHAHRLINKILHVPLKMLDRRDTKTPLEFYAAALRGLFGLEDAVPTTQEEPEQAESSP